MGKSKFKKVKLLESKGYQIVRKVDIFGLYNILLDRKFLQQFSYQMHMCYQNKSQEVSSNKLAESAHTDTTSNNFIKKKFSLQSCLSSRSINEKQGREKFLPERRLFMRFLFTMNSKGNVRILEEMSRYYRSNCIQSPELQIFGKQTPRIIQIPELYSKQHVETMNYFCGIWLMQMGYKSQNHKNSIMERIKLQLSTQQLYRAVTFYEVLGDGFLSGLDRWYLIISICANGWQILSQKIIQYCKIMNICANK